MRASRPPYGGRNRSTRPPPAAAIRWAVRVISDSTAAGGERGQQRMRVGVIADRAERHLAAQVGGKEVDAPADGEERCALVRGAELLERVVGVGPRPIVKGEGDGVPVRAGAVDREPEAGQALDRRVLGGLAGADAHRTGGGACVRSRASGSAATPGSCGGMSSRAAHRVTARLDQDHHGRDDQHGESAHRREPSASGPGAAGRAPGGEVIGRSWHRRRG